jgi:hypothetical protein
MGEVVALESAQKIKASRRLRSDLCARMTGFMAIFLREIDAIVVLVDLGGSVAAHGEDGNAWLDRCVDENSSACSDVSSSFMVDVCILSSQLFCSHPHRLLKTHELESIMLRSKDMPFRSTATSRP